MPDFNVAMNTSDVLRLSVYASDELVNEIFVASKTIVLQDPCIRFLDHDGLVKILQSEALGVMPAVVGFRQVLAKEIMRQMTIYANSDCVVARLLPRVVLWLHDVAVDADLGIIAHVGEPFRVQKRVAADAQQHASHNGRQADRRLHTMPGAFSIVCYSHRAPPAFEK